MGQEGLTQRIIESDETLEFLRREKKAHEAKIRADEREKGTTPTKTFGEPIVAYEKGMPNIIHGNKKPEPKSLQEIWAQEDREKREREEE